MFIKEDLYNTKSWFKIHTLHTDQRMTKNQYGSVRPRLFIKNMNLLSHYIFVQSKR